MSFLRAQSASLSTLNSPRGCRRSAAAAVQGPISAEADGKCPPGGHCPVADKALGTCQPVVDVWNRQ